MAAGSREKGSQSITILTPQGALLTLPALFSRPLPGVSDTRSARGFDAHETYLSAKQSAPQAHARISRPHGDEGRPSRSRPTPLEGPQEAGSLSLRSTWPTVRLAAGSAFAKSVDCGDRPSSRPYARKEGAAAMLCSPRRRSATRSSTRASGSRSRSRSPAAGSHAIGCGERCANPSGCISTSCRPSTWWYRPGRPRRQQAAPSCGRASRVFGAR